MQRLEQQLGSMYSWMRVDAALASGRGGEENVWWSPSATLLLGGTASYPIYACLKLYIGGRMSSKVLN
jgi:hypothetical protein